MGNQGIFFEGYFEIFLKNQPIKVNRIEASTAVQKSVISNPGTIQEASISKKTLIKKANIPRVKIERGSAINCNTGLIYVFITPIMMAATIAFHKFVMVKPGSKYSTISKAITLTLIQTKAFTNPFLCGSSGVNFTGLAFLVAFLEVFFLAIINNEQVRKYCQGIQVLPIAIQIVQISAD